MGTVDTWRMIPCWHWYHLPLRNLRTEVTRKQVSAHFARGNTYILDHGCDLGKLDYSYSERYALTYTNDIAHADALNLSRVWYIHICSTL